MPQLIGSLQKLGTNSFTKSWVLTILPIIYFTLSILTHFQLGPFYQRLTDPEYFHLLNGINVALFNLATPYVDHPGTPLQIIVAISSWPVSLSIPGFIVENAINHPETFISAAIITMNFSIAVILLLVGFKIYQATQNIWISLLIQMTPFGNVVSFEIFGRLTPESFMIVPILLLFAFLILFLFSNKTTLNNRQILYLAIIGGLGMAIKFSYVPFLIIPFIILKRPAKILRYTLTTIVATGIFAFPILFNFTKAFSWFSNMLVKSGRWGSGNSGFIEWDQIPYRLSELLKVNYAFPVLIALLIIVMLLTFVIGRNKDPFLLKLNSISAGVILGIFFSVFLITKHFSVVYYFSTLLFQSILFVLIIEYVKIISTVNIRKSIFYSIGAIVFAIIIIIQVPTFITSLNNHKNKMRLYSEWSNEVLSHSRKDVPIIISSFYAGSPFIEFSLNNGYLLCGNLKSTFQSALKEKYPESIMYVNWSEQFYRWNDFIDADDFINPNLGVTIFIGNENSNHKEVIINRIQESFPDYTISSDTICNNSYFNETYYQVRLTK